MYIYIKKKQPVKDYLEKEDDILVDTLREEKDLYRVKNIKMAQAKKH